MDVPGFFISLAEGVDFEWLRLTVEGGYLWSLVRLVAFMLGIGGVAGWFAAKHRYRPKAEQSEKHERTDRDRRKLVRGFSQGKARAILATYGVDGQVKATDDLNDVLKSFYAREGIFEVNPKLSPFGDKTYGPYYNLTDEWRAFLKRPWNRRALKMAAGE